MLTIQIRDPAGKEAALHAHEGTRCLIGRGTDCDVILGGWKVSRRHAELFVSNERVFVRDLDSTFGTLLNDNRVADAVPVAEDDALHIGPHALQVRWQRGDSPKAAATGMPAVAVPSAGAAPAPPATPAMDQTQGLQPDELFRVRRLLHERLLEAFDVRRTDTHRMADAELRELTERLIREQLADMAGELPPGADHQALLDQVRDEAIGLGPLEPLLADASITEIMVNRANEVFVERGGQLQRWPVAFTSDRAVQGIIERIVAPIGRRIDESSPMVDARLKDGSRVNAVIPPLALKGPSITIRKFSKRKLDASDLLRFGSSSPAMVEFLRVCVEQRKNMLISGGTGSGKTTLLNILSNFIPDGERIVTIEDAAELQLHHSNIVALEARPANIEGKGLVSIRELVKNSLRMRPDRIVVGECRGGEALDMLQAMNTGHDGSLTTVHANTPRDALTRIETMIALGATNLPERAMRQQISSAIQFVVQQTRLSDGSRKITSISEITGMEGDTITMQEIFLFEKVGITQDGKVTGRFRATGVRPKCCERLKTAGIHLPADMFEGATEVR